MPMQVSPETAATLLGYFERAPEHIAATVHLFAIMHVRLVMNLARHEACTALCESYAARFLTMPESRFKNISLFGLHYCLLMNHRLASTYTGRYDFDQHAAPMLEYYEKSSFDFASSGSSGATSIGGWITMVGSHAPPGALDEYIAALQRMNATLAGTPLTMFAGAYELALGELQIYRGELEAAEATLRVSIQKALADGQWNIAHRGYFYQMRLAFGTGDLEKATQALGEMEGLLAEPNCATRYQLYDIALAYYYIMLGQPEAVPLWIKGSCSDFLHPSFIENFGNRLKLRYKLATRQYVDLLANFKAQEGKALIYYGKIERKIAEAVCHYHLKDVAGAMEAFRQAYELAAPECAIFPFIEAGKEVRTLAAAAQRNGACRIPQAWLVMIGEKASANAKHRCRMVSEYRLANPEAMGITLSGREKDVLTDLYYGRSRAEIAQSRGISVNTVKTISNSLYSKLGANNLADLIRIGIETKQLAV
jgi:DNA-binding CsgD family transcriptional regulator